MLLSKWSLVNFSQQCVEICLVNSKKFNIILNLAMPVHNTLEHQYL